MSSKITFHIRWAFVMRLTFECWSEVIDKAFHHLTFTSSFLHTVTKIPNIKKKDYSTYISMRNRKKKSWTKLPKEKKQQKENRNKLKCANSWTEKKINKCLILENETWNGSLFRPHRWMLGGEQQKRLWVNLHYSRPPRCPSARKSWHRLDMEPHYGCQKLPWR